MYLNSELTMTLLLVDDEEDLLEMFKDFLEGEGLNVVTAPSGAEALKILDNRPDISLIISDSNMGKMSGLEFLKKAQEMKEICPPFYLSTGGTELSDNELKELGVARVILKPFDLDLVLDHIREDLAKR